MSSNHKAPLTAFVVVAIACVVVLATSSMRSYARDAWRTFSAPVVDGLSLIHREGVQPADPQPSVQTVADEELAAPAVPRKPQQRFKQGSSGADAATAVKVVLGPPQTPVRTQTAAPTPTFVPPVPPQVAPPTRPTNAWPTTEAPRGWDHGRHLGWAKVPTRGLPSATKSRGNGLGHVSVPTTSKATPQRGHGAKGAKAQALTSKVVAAKAKASAVKAEAKAAAVQATSHGNGAAQSSHGRGAAKH